MCEHDLHFWRAKPNIGLAAEKYRSLEADMAGQGLDLDPKASNNHCTGGN